MYGQRTKVTAVAKTTAPVGNSRTVIGRTVNGNTQPWKRLPLELGAVFDSR